MAKAVGGIVSHGWSLESVYKDFQLNRESLHRASLCFMIVPLAGIFTQSPYIFCNLCRSALFAPSFPLRHNVTTQRVVSYTLAFPLPQGCSNVHLALE